MNGAMPTLSIGLPNFGSWFADLRQLVGAAADLEGAGVDRVVLVDHVVLGPDPDSYPWGRFPTGSDGDWHEPLTALAAIAATTEQLRLGTGILVAALRPAAVLAKTVATLDALSGGRVDLGVGVGWQRAEFDAVGLDFDQRGRLLDDVIGACRALWQQSPAHFDSHSIAFDQVWCHPKPVQERLPVLFAGTLGSRNLRRIVQLGDGWIPIMDATLDQVADGAVRLREAWLAAGRHGQPHVRVPLPLVRTDHGGLALTATAALIPKVLAAGATELSVSAQSLARPGDVAGLVDRARSLAELVGASAVDPVT